MMGEAMPLFGKKAEQSSKVGLNKLKNVND